MSTHAIMADEQSHSSQLDDPSNSRCHSLKHSLLQRYADDEVHDLVCVGFGPASLAIAVALNDALELADTVLTTNCPKVRFLERQQAFAWHAGMLLPGTKMQITFIKDLATMRNPRSHFTFLNYLHENGRLAAFTNLGTFLPQRIEYEDYMRWSANHFEDVVDYSTDVRAVDVGSRHPQTGCIEDFVVTSVDGRSGRESTVRARHIVIAAGGKPSMPQGLPLNHPRIIHSSQYATEASGIFINDPAPRAVAIIGAGQSAAEVFHNVPSKFPGTQANLLIRGAALRPSDDSPFVNEIFDPERVDDFFDREEELRARSIALDRATNYGVVRLELLEELYAQLYSQRIRMPNEKDWPLRIREHSTVTSVEDITSNGEKRLRLHITNSSSKYNVGKRTAEETLDVDLLVVASGYVRNAHEDMLKDLKSSLRLSEATGGCIVNRDYSVQFKDNALSHDAGIWLQGCNEQTHGLSDTLLSILAIRGGEMVQSIFGMHQTSTTSKLTSTNRHPLV